MRAYGLLIVQLDYSFYMTHSLSTRSAPATWQARYAVDLFHKRTLPTPKSAVNGMIGRYTRCMCVHRW